MFSCINKLSARFHHLNNRRRSLWQNDCWHRCGSHFGLKLNSWVILTMCQRSLSSTQHRYMDFSSYNSTYICMREKQSEREISWDVTKTSKCREMSFGWGNLGCFSEKAFLSSEWVTGSGLNLNLKSQTSGISAAATFVRGSLADNRRHYYFLWEGKVKDKIIPQS